MLDRTLIIVLILFLAAGGFYYEKYAAEKGDVGPVGRLIDFAKFGKASEFLQSSSSHKILKYNSRASLTLLREKHNRLENQRVQLVENRRQLLAQLDAIHDQVTDEALRYSHLIEEDRDRFLDRFPELEEIGGAIIQTSEIPDPGDREEKYRVVRRKLEDILGELVASRPEGVARLNQVLEEIDMVVSQEEAVLASCPDWDVCIHKELDDLKGEVKTVSDDILDSARADIDKMVKMTNDLREQYKALAQNLDVNDRQIEDNNDVMTGKLKLLAENLLSVTESNLQDVVNAYEEVEAQQEVLLENIVLHQERVKEIQEQNSRRAKEIMENLNRVPRFDFGNLSRVNNHVVAERSKIFTRFRDNEFRLQKIVRERWTENSSLLVELAQNAPIDGSNLVEDRKYTERRSLNARSNLQPASKQNFSHFERSNDIKTGSSRTDSGRTGLGRIEPLRPTTKHINNRKPEEAAEQFKRLKDKARDQGF